MPQINLGLAYTNGFTNHNWLFFIYLKIPFPSNSDPHWYITTVVHNVHLCPLLAQAIGPFRVSNPGPK